MVWSIRVLFICIVYRHYKVVDSIVLRLPNNAAVAQGSNVSFECGGNETNKIRFNYFRLGSKDPKTAWSGEIVAENLTFEGFFADSAACRNTNTCFIGIVAVNVKTAGYIVCRELGKQVKYVASLVVLESTTQCKLNVSTTRLSDGTSAVYVNDTDNIAIHCSVRYSGNWVPVIQCSTYTSAAKRTSSIMNQVLYDDVISTTSNLHGKHIQCTTSFQSDVEHRRPSGLYGHIEVDNVPSLQLSWKSPDIIILQRVGDVSSQAPTSVELTSVYQSTSDNHIYTSSAVSLTPAVDRKAADEDPFRQLTFYVMMGLMALLALCVIAIIALVVTVVKKRGNRSANVTSLSPTGNSTVSSTCNSQSSRCPTETAVTSSRTVDDARLFSNVGGSVPTVQHGSLATGLVCSDAVEQNIYNEIEVTPTQGDQQTPLVKADYLGLDRKSVKILDVKPPPVYARINKTPLTSTSCNKIDEDDETCSKQQQQQQSGQEYLTLSRSSEYDECHYSTEKDAYAETQLYEDIPATATSGDRGSICYQGLDNNLTYTKCNNSQTLKQYELLKTNRTANDEVESPSKIHDTNGCSVTAAADNLAYVIS